MEKLDDCGVARHGEYDDGPAGASVFEARLAGPAVLSYEGRGPNMQGVMRDARWVHFRALGRRRRRGGAGDVACRGSSSKSAKSFTASSSPSSGEIIPSSSTSTLTQLLMKSSESVDSRHFLSFSDPGLGTGARRKMDSMNTTGIVILSSASSAGSLQ
mmetsp:Transcript_3200/g.6853  ORF Transcript_3200/g.6853 Transcript_3200/m.6853 type:complete len:158 (+) Transcript_3200:304-777(+)|eukprot:CAMPEP_0182811868 /NCGR_PEP_ID=MMETSP0006_2-20121128/8499_1 /TAXON_ID=97485 /ORGANISM="Prymnesium parvum, Strain Texoma1" /LENGTH=157 /DNA_ID=CAMNT_0024937853 /DNA_START=834 /DNA_END=1307 /DNA_ORIENTATION=+